MPITLLLLILTNSCEKPIDPIILAEISTTEVTLITEASAQSGGFISSDGGIVNTVRGVCWSTSPNPTIADSTTNDAAGTGRFISKITGLSPNTVYYLKAYATNEYGTAYGLQETFSTKSLGLTTKEITDITVNSASSGGFIAIAGDSSNIIARGLCWNTQQNPTIDNFITTDDKGSGEFNSTLTDLEINTTYYVRSYVTNSGGTYYGNELSFITRDGIVSLTTLEVSSITDNSAMTGGDITDDGGAEVTSRGVCWSTNPNPTTDDYITTNGRGIGFFSSSITGLTINTSYYLRAFATNSIGTTYGDQQTFSTIAYVIPTISSSAVTNINNTSATCGGDIASDGGSPVTERGVCWSSNPNPTTADSKTVDGSGAGAFNSSITGLTVATSYYVRAYATNSAGTAYGNEHNFMTLAHQDVKNPITGRVWMDRNLGASRAATISADAQAYGDYYQWGRNADGHEKKNSVTTGNLSSSDTPGHNKFILTSSSPYDWRSPQNSNLWQGVNGTNNPCPGGYRLPTETEWDAELKSWSTNNLAGAFSSPLRLPAAGARISSNATYYGVDTHAYYWSSTVSGTGSRTLVIFSKEAFLSTDGHTYGHSVRCIKD